MLRVRPAGFEPTTSELKVRCSTDWATDASCEVFGFTNTPNFTSFHGLLKVITNYTSVQPLNAVVLEGDRGDLNPQLSEPQSEVLPIELQPQLGRQESDLPNLAPKTSASPLGYAPKFQDGWKIAFLIPN